MNAHDMAQMQQMMRETIGQDMRQSLNALVRARAGQLDAMIVEYDQGTPGYGSSNPGFAAQTSGIEVIQGFLVAVPADASDVILTIGEYQFPLTSATPGAATASILHSLQNLQIVTKSSNRSLTFTSASTTLSGTTLLWGVAAPAGNAPGRLH